VEYSLSGNNENVSLIQNGGKTKYQILIPDNFTGYLYYQFGAIDTSQNLKKTSIKTLKVSDNDAPIIDYDYSQSTGTTGDPYDFKVKVKDNIGLQTIYIEYSIGRDPPKTAKMIASVNYSYLNIDLPSKSNKDLYYTISAYDLNNNVIISEMKTVQIIDNDPPKIKVPKGKGVFKTRGLILFEANVTDNIGEDLVLLEYWYSGEEKNTAVMEKISDNYTVFLDVEDERIIFRFLAFDKAKNEAKSEIYILDDNLSYSQSSLETLVEFNNIGLIIDNEKANVGDQLLIGIVIKDQDGHILPTELFAITWTVLNGPGDIDENGNFISNEGGISTIRAIVSYNDMSVQSEIEIEIIDIDTVPVEEDQGEWPLIPIIGGVLIFIGIIISMGFVLNKTQFPSKIIVSNDIIQFESDPEEIINDHLIEIEVNENPSNYPLEELDQNYIIDDESIPTLEELNEMIDYLDQDPEIEDLMILLDEMSHDEDEIDY
jgi:hypothetical protein